MQVENTTAKKTVNTRKPLTDEQKRIAAEKRAANKQAATFTFAAYAALTVAAFLAKGSSFYSRAIIYHRQQSTTFPRKRNEHEAARLAALPPEKAKQEVDAVVKMHDSRTLASGNKTAQVMFDHYMVSISK